MSCKKKLLTSSINLIRPLTELENSKHEICRRRWEESKFVAWALEWQHVCLRALDHPNRMIQERCAPICKLLFLSACTVKAGDILLMHFALCSKVSLGLIVDDIAYMLEL